LASRKPSDPLGNEAALTPEVQALGTRISATLARTDYDITSQWIAMYLAQLMTEASTQSDPKAAKDAAAACAELILTVWERRSDWPDGWPPGRADQLLNSLESIGTTRRRLSMPPEGAPRTWIDALPVVAASLDAERDLWELAALTSLDVGELEAAIEGPQLDASEQIERNDLKRIVKAANEAAPLLRAKLGLAPTGRASGPPRSITASAIARAIRETQQQRSVIAKGCAAPDEGSA
jgi:hypothetical protein